MGLEAGGHFGSYEIVSPLGAGGMGEVYRARDAKLGRDVALKVLPDSMAPGPQRMARFEREAKTLASLNHPNIASIYGLEESAGAGALVMELVEGETLQERIARSSKARTSLSGGPVRLQTEECLSIAKQIAEALEYAHEHGVVHRDLKPANVKITPQGTVKVLDFGLAKVLTGGDSAAPMDPSNSPTLSIAATNMGLILGTAAYMAPEQAKGKTVDRRADIWALGCVLYEMLAGRRAFEGETISDVLASVIKSEPDWSALPAETPPAMRKLLRRCLQKDPRQRLHDMGDVRLAIEETLSGADVDGDSGGTVAEPKRATLLRRSLPWALGATAVLFAAVAGYFWLQPKPALNMIQFAVAAPENTAFDAGGFSLSPDGRYLAFVGRASADKPSMLWVRPLDSLTATEIPGTEGAYFPFWSPDSQQIAFGVHGNLEKVAASGGPPITLCDMRNLSLPFPLHITVGAWSREGVILFTNPGGVYQVPDSGGAPTLVVAPDAAANESGLRLPSFLPDGRHFLVLLSQNSGPDMLAVGSLDSKKLEKLGPSGSNTYFAPPGFVLYVEQATLMARPFSVRGLRFTGPATPIAQNVGVNTGPQYGSFSVSSTGILAYRALPSTSTNQMTWFNRDGKTLGTVGQPDVYATPALSPDGAKLAVSVGQQPSADIWAYDLKRGTSSRLTFNTAYDVNPVWSPDGSQIYFSSTRSPAWGIFKKAADGLGNTEPVLDSGKQDKSLNDVSRDGRYAIYDTVQSGPLQLWAFPLTGSGQPFAYVQGSFDHRSGQFSPNGHYLAYASNETGRFEVYVQTFPQHTGRWEISTAGGEEPMWRSDGKELYYLAPDDSLMAVDVNTSSTAFEAGTPKELFKAPLVPLSYWRNLYVPSADGQRFLMITPSSQAKPEPITMVVNWQEMLKQK